MKNSPWAKLMRRATPSMSASPAATMAYMEPRVSPCSTCSRTSIRWGPRNGPQVLQARELRPLGLPGKRSEHPGGAVALLEDTTRSIQQRRARLELLEDAQLAVAHLEQDHVDHPRGLLLELIRPGRGAFASTSLRAARVVRPPGFPCLFHAVPDR